MMDLKFAENCLAPPPRLAHNALLVFIAKFMGPISKIAKKWESRRRKEKSGTKGNGGGQCELRHHLNPTVILAQIS